MSKIDKSTRFYAPDRAAWRNWLHENHLTSEGVWLVYFKKDSGKSRVPYADAVEEALCFGWIDSTLNPGDDQYYMQLYTPRKKKSGWSKLNKERIAFLLEQNLVMPAGLQKIEEAKEAGTWHKLDDIEAFVIPEELEKAFIENPEARAFFETLSKTNRKMILYRVNGAKLAATKKARIDDMVSALKEQRLPDRFVVTKAK